jgi:hypothetical protein
MTDGRFWSVALNRRFWWLVVCWTKTPAMWVDECVHYLMFFVVPMNASRHTRNLKRIGMGRPTTQCTSTFILSVCKIIVQHVLAPVGNPINDASTTPSSCSFQKNHRHSEYLTDPDILRHSHHTEQQPETHRTTTNQHVWPNCNGLCLRARKSSRKAAAM